MSLLILAAVFLYASPVCADRGTIIIVSLNRTSLEQLAADSILGPWLGKGAKALVNVSAAGHSQEGHGYISMGAGSRAVSGESAPLAFNASEIINGQPVADIFRRRQGKDADGQVVHLGMASLRALNNELRHTVLPGLLGETLRSAERKTAVLGNADEDMKKREAVLMLADGKGQVDTGDVGEELLADDPSFPYGVRVDNDALWQRLVPLMATADVVLVDWGDTARLDSYRELLAAEVYREQRTKVFRDVGMLLERITAKMAVGDLLLVVSAAAPKGGRGAETFGYVLVIGEDFPPGSLLFSPSTRSSGLVTAADFAPFILSQAGLEPPQGMSGRGIVVRGEGNSEWLLEKQSQITRIHLLRPPLLKFYVFLQILLAIVALLSLFFQPHRQRVFSIALLSLLVVPVVLLYLPLYRVALLPAAFLLAIAGVAAVSFLLHFFWHRPAARFAVLGLVTAFSLALDLLRGGVLIKNSVLGYDPVAGARYYGLGNEYMGVFIGAAVLGAVSLLTLFPRQATAVKAFAAAAFFFAVPFLAAPAGGANFGGMVTSLAAFSVTAVMFFPKGNTRYKVPAIILSIVLVIALGLSVGLNILVSPAEKSHLGVFLNLVAAEGHEALADVVVRKVDMNVRLFRYSHWSRAFIAFLAAMVILLFRPQGIIINVRKEYPYLAAGVTGIAVGSVTAFLVNDSGVVPAATTLLFAGVPLIILCGEVIAGRDKSGQGEVK